MKFLCFLSMVSFIANVVLLSMLFSERATTKEQFNLLVKKNTNTMGEIGYVSERIFENTGTMMRYSHYLDNHDPATTGPVRLCPECSGNEDKIVPMGPEEGEEINPDGTSLEPTFDQLISDADEIHNSIYRIKGSLYNQGIKLKSTLERLREKK